MNKKVKPRPFIIRDDSNELSSSIEIRTPEKHIQVVIHNLHSPFHSN